MEAKLNSPQSEEIPQARLLPRVENAPGYLVPPRIRFPTPLEHLLNPPRELKRLPPIDFNIPSYQETPQETYPRTEDKVA